MKCTICGTEKFAPGMASNINYHTDAMCRDVLKAKLASTEERLKGWIDQEHVMCMKLVEAEAQLAERDAEVARLRDALEWYARSDNYMHTFDRVAGPDVLSRMYVADEKTEAGWRPVVLDAGERARQALADDAEKKT